MASTEVVELDSDSSSDEVEEAPRKPIGWNYQLGASKIVRVVETSEAAKVDSTLKMTKAASMSNTTKVDGSSNTTKAKPRSNGASVPARALVSASHQSLKETDDDLQIIEVKVTSESKHTLPASSSRAEIRRQVRNATQSSISNFFTSKKDDDTTQKERKKDDSGPRKKKKEEPKSENEEEEEDDDRSAANMEEFMRRWNEIKTSKDDEKIRDKLWKYYHLAHTSYTHSKKFIRILETSTRKLTVDNIYVVIKDILDCLKLYKDIPFREKESMTESAGTSREGTPTPIVMEDNKINRRLRKVEKKMEEISHKIKELEEAEVDLEDDDNSAYLVEDRLKRQFSKLHDYYCRIANCSSATGRPTEKKFKFRGSKWVEINKRITSWVNKHKEFPDYVDILNLVKKVTKQSNLPLRPETVRVQAQEIFRDVGKMLKYRRESDDLYSIYSYMDEEKEDPAINDEALNQQLNENEKIATEQLNKIFQDYVDKDTQQRELADITTQKGKTSNIPTQNSPVKDSSRTAQCQADTSETLCKNTVKEEGLKSESSVASVESNVTTKTNSDESTNSDRNVQNDGREVETISDVEDTASDIEDGKSNDGVISTEESQEDETDDTSDVEDERNDMEQQRPCVGAKAEEELEEGDETDDDLKVILATACVDEEEDDSEEDIPVVDTQDLELERKNDDNSSSANSVLCLDDDNQNPKTTTDHLSSFFTENSCTVKLSSTTTTTTTAAAAASPDRSLHTSTTTTTTITAASPDSTTTTPTTTAASPDKPVHISTTTTMTDATPDGPVDSSTTTSPVVTSEPLKRQLDESFSPSKKCKLTGVELS